ncbi:MAG: thioredoxin family protein [Candidatus Cryptobacteroides sp.]
MKHRLLLCSLLALTTTATAFAQVRELTDDEWYELDIVRPVVVDVYAPWCQSCENYSPEFDEVASEFSGKADFYRINGDKYKDFCAGFGIQAYPSTLIMSENYPDCLSVEAGALEYNELKQYVQKAIEQFEYMSSLTAEALMEISTDYYCGQNGKEKKRI